MEYSFFDGLGVSCGVFPCGWWDSPIDVVVPMVGLSRALQNSSLDCFAPSLCSGRAFESHLQKKTLSTLHGESTRGIHGGGTLPRPFG